MTHEVAEPSLAYERMASKWALPLTLWGGVTAMRAAGESYLPKQLRESEAAYDRRLKRSFLFNAFKETVQNLTGKVFSKEIVVEDEPAQIEDWLENVDLAGQDLNVFSRDLFQRGATNGLGHILVDMQRNQEAKSLAEERAAGLRPYFKLVPAEDLIAWRSELIQGAPTLTQIRVREDTTEPQGEFGEAEFERIRVIERDNFRLFEKAGEDQDAEWTLVDEGPMTLGVIPLATFYAQRTGFLEAEPPFEELAWLNAAHWQSASDQRHILHIARVPILFGTGLPDDEEGPPLEIGADRMIEGPMGSTLEYIEHRGEAINSGRQDLLDLEERMRIMGLEPLIPKGGQPTATAKAIDTAQANSQLQAMTIGLGNALEQALSFMAMWANLGDEVGSVKVNDDFGLSLRDAQDVRALIDLRLAGEISRETLYAELKRRGLLRDEFDGDDEVERLEQEGPPLGTIGLEDEPPEPQLEDDQVAA